MNEFDEHHTPFVDCACAHLSQCVHFRHLVDHDDSLKSRMGFACCLLVKDSVSNDGL